MSARPPSLSTAMAASLPAAADRRLALAALAVLIAVGLAQFADYLTFVRMIAVAGVGAELNPLVVRGLETLGMVALAVAKLALVVLVAAVFAVVARSHGQMAGVVATTGTVAGLVGAFSNVFALV